MCPPLPVPGPAVAASCCQHRAPWSLERSPLWATCQHRFVAVPAGDSFLVPVLWGADLSNLHWCSCSLISQLTSKLQKWDRWCGGKSNFLLIPWNSVVFLWTSWKCVKLYAVDSPCRPKKSRGGKAVTHYCCYQAVAAFSFRSDFLAGVAEGGLDTPRFCRPFCPFSCPLAAAVWEVCPVPCSEHSREGWYILHVPLSPATKSPCNHKIYIRYSINWLLCKQTSRWSKAYELFCATCCLWLVIIELLLSNLQARSSIILLVTASTLNLKCSLLCRSCLPVCSGPPYSTGLVIVPAQGRGRRCSVAELLPQLFFMELTFGGFCRQRLSQLEPELPVTPSLEACVVFRYNALVSCLEQSWNMVTIPQVRLLLYSILQSVFCFLNSTWTISFCQHSLLKTSTDSLHFRSENEF